jgi:ubiquinone/menaquinone biosynthesis C-methylase UbiE
MPFADQAFDAVVNVESSHCYGDMGLFLAEVHRVLRPGGELLWADLRDEGPRLDSVFRLFDSCALALAHERDVTPGVLNALRLDNARKTALIEAWFPRVVHPLVRPSAGLEGTRNYVRMAAGSTQYWSARLLKAAPMPR